MKPVTSSLTVRATLVVVVFLGAFVGIGLVVVDRAETAVVDVERPRLQAATAQLADAVAYGVLARSAALLEAPVVAFQQTPDLTSIVVLDDAGNELISRRFGDALLADDSDGDGAPDVDLEAAVVTRGSAPGDDGDLAAFGIAATSEQRVGTVRVSWSLSGVREVQRRLRKAIVISVAAIGLLALFVAGALSSGLVVRVRTLAAAARRVSEGEAGVTVEVDGQDELAQLATDFNAMTASLVVQQQRLHEQGAALAERESLAALGRATAVIAHELRNPLGIVLAAAEIVKNESRPIAARAEAAGMIEDEVRRLERTLDDLLTHARPRPAHCTSFDVVACVNDAVARTTRSGGPAEAVAVVVDATTGPLFVDADAGFVQQIVWNLVQNAAQAGAQNVCVSVTGDEAARLCVSDDGAGLSAAARARLFQPFSTTRQRGTGLGLSASRRMAEDMGGDLVAIDVDVGACFVLRVMLSVTGAANKELL